MSLDRLLITNRSTWNRYPSSAGRLRIYFFIGARWTCPLASGLLLSGILAGNFRNIRRPRNWTCDKRQTARVEQVFALTCFDVNSDKNSAFGSDAGERISLRPGPQSVCRRSQDGETG